MNTIKGVIEDWVAVYDNKNLDTHFHIIGTTNGGYIRTSRVIKIEDNIVTTRNSNYQLGFPKLSIYTNVYDDEQMPSDEDTAKMNVEYSNTFIRIK